MKLFKNKGFKKSGKIFVIMILAITVPIVSVFMPINNVHALKEVASNDLERQLIPLPLEYYLTEGQFTLTDNTKIYVDGKTSDETNEIYKIGEYLADKFRPSTGYDFSVEKGTASNNGHIVLTTKGDFSSLGDEGYKLTTTTAGVKVEANKPEGLFRGIQTLRQLLPASIEKKILTSDVKWEIPCSHIEDKPEYSYRGTMMDVSRHFFTVEQVKRHIDNAAQYKMNKLHIHLSDDQGWRLEIEGERYGENYSALTEIGATTSVNHEGGGYYTQAEFKDIIQYASDRYVEVIPEFDMPGHTQAALASLGFLNPNGQKNGSVYEGIAVGFSTFMCNSEKTYEFIDDVFKQVAAISPSKYIHIGGDEAHSTSKEDYKTFMTRVTEIAKKYGKTPIGWQTYDEAVDDSEAVVQYWNTGIHKLKDGQKHVMSPADKAYMDMKYNSDSEYGLQWAGMNPTDDAYNWNPSDYGTKDQILGIEATLWAETLNSNRALDYMSYPKLPGHAEVGWTPKEKRNWDEYKGRLIAHAERWKNQGIAYYEDPSLWEVEVEPLNAQWNMNEGTGSIINDKTSTYPGTLNDKVEWIDGKYGKGLAFKGDGYVDLGLPDLQGDWTIGLWVNRHNNTTKASVLLSGNEGEVKLEQWKDTKKVGISKFGIDDYTFDYTAPLDEWVHLGFVQDSEGTSLYVNGEKQGHLNVTMKAPAKRIGATCKSGLAEMGFIQGDIDEIKIYNKALKTDEMKLLLERSDKVDLSRAIRAAKEVDGNVYLYTPLSFQTCKAAIDKIMAAAEDLKNDFEASQESVDKMTAKIDEALALLVERADNSALTKAITEAEKVDNELYTKSSFAEFKKVLDSAKAVDANATQQTVDEMVIQLTKAKALLKARGSIKAIEELLHSYKDLSKTEYSEETWKAFEKQKKLAENAISDNSDITEAKMLQLYDSLKSSFDALVKTDKEDPKQEDDILKDPDGSVSISGQFPKGTTLSSKIFNEKELTNLIEKINNVNSQFLKTTSLEKVFDLNLMLDNQKYNPNKAATVRFKIDEVLIGKNLGIIYIDDQGNIQKIESVKEEGYIEFDVEHFSTYAIVSYKENNVEINQPGEGVQPKTDDTNSILGYGEILIISLGIVSIALKRKKQEQ